MKSHFIPTIFALSAHLIFAQEPVDSGFPPIKIHHLDNDKSFNSPDAKTFPPREKSYWVPYTDRTSAVLTFPVIPDEQEQEITKQQHNPWNKWTTYGPPPLKFKRKVIAKPKSDLGIVVSRNSILKENFRDYAELCKFPKDMKPSDDLVTEMTKQFMESPYHAPAENFAIVAMESRLSTSPNSLISSSSGRFFESKINNNNYNQSPSSDSTRPLFHNGTVTLRSSKNPRLMMSIPFTLKSLGNIEPMLSRLQSIQELDPREKQEVQSFLKVILRIHTESFQEGQQAMDRFLMRTVSLNRPNFTISVENTTETKLPEPRESEAKMMLKLVADQEEQHRRESWLQTSTVAMRVISSPSFQVKDIPIQTYHVPQAPLIHTYLPYGTNYY